MNNLDFVEIIKPDDWHVHLREGDMMQAVTQYSSRINHRCIVMPNLETPITTSKQGEEYKNTILALNKIWDLNLPKYFETILLELKKDDLVRVSGTFSEGDISEGECLHPELDSNPELYDENFMFEFTEIEHIPILVEDDYWINVQGQFNQLNQLIYEFLN